MQFQDLTKRFVSTLISLAVLACIFIFSNVGIVKWFIALFVAGIGSIAIWEYCRLAQFSRKNGLGELCMIIGAVTILSFFITTFSPTISFLPFIILFIGAVSLFFFHFDKVSGSMNSMAVGLFGVIYVAAPLGLALKILWGDGRAWLIYLLIVTKITDVGAYFGGRLLGGKKLAPAISPGKTLSGAVVGFFSAIVFSMLFFFCARWIPSFSLTLIESIWLGALLGFLGQVGDLGESLFKRDANVKDSNRLPGFGGVLDMLDSLLLTTPIVYFFLYMH